MFQLGLLSFFVLQTIGVQANRYYNIRNKCPTDITLYINGVSQGTLAASGGFVQESFANDFDGFIFTDANGGNKNGSGATRAGFYGTVSIFFKPFLSYLATKYCPLDILE
jgi:hypothetical protein